MSRTARVLVATSAALGAAITLALVITLGIALVVPYAGVLPNDKARVFGMTLTEAAAGMALLPLYTLPVALFLAWKRPDRRTVRRTAGAAFAALLVTFLLPMAWVWIDPPHVTDASDFDRAELIAGTIGGGVFDAWLLALITVPLASALGWRSARRAR
jgi:hypothetical protein